MAQQLGSWEEAVRWLREQPDKGSIVRDAYFDDPLIDAAHRYWQSNEWTAVRALIGTGPGAALDAGAGRGIASYALAKDGFTVTALEPDPSSLVGGQAIKTLAREGQLDIRVEENLSERLPFADASFDVVFARAVLHHIGDLNAAMREFHRVLKPGGVLLAIREHVISGPWQLQAFFDQHPLHHRYGGENAHPVAFYQQAIKSSGLRLERTIGSLDSPINFGPQDEAVVVTRIIDRLMPLPAIRPLVRGMCSFFKAGPLLRRLGSTLDNRPGRHAAFLARRIA